MDLKEQRCKHCGQSAYRLFLLALIQDAGAEVYPSAERCSEQQEHEFEQTAQKRAAP